MLLPQAAPSVPRARPVAPAPSPDHRPHSLASLRISPASAPTLRRSADDEPGVSTPTGDGGAAPSCPVSDKGTVSTVSWGETSGLYPSSKDKYDPSKWDPAKTCELLAMRACIHLVGDRGERVHRASPKEGDRIEQLLAKYHYTENFPAADPLVKDDPTVKWFFLSGQSDGPAAHPGVAGSTRVKGFGSFYNIGGGDVARGDTWVHFYRK